MSTTVKDLEGRFCSDVLLRAQIARSPFFRPFTELQIGHSYSNIYDIEYRDRRDWSSGKVSAIDLGFHVYPKGLRLRNQFDIKAKIADGSIGSDFDFTRLEATANFRYRPTKKVIAAMRLHGGTVSGSPALQDRHFLFGGMELAGILSPLADAAE